MAKKVGTLTIEKDFLEGKLVSSVSSKERKAMVDTEHKLSLNKQCITKERHLQQTQIDDLIIFDRGYPSYNMFATIITNYDADFLIRVKTNTYKEHTAPLFEKDGDVTDIVVTMRATTKIVKNTCLEEKLPLEIQVRFVKVILDNGDIEVLATSVLDQQRLNKKRTNQYHLIP